MRSNFDRVMVQPYRCLHSGRTTPPGTLPEEFEEERRCHCAAFMPEPVEVKQS